MIKLKNNPPAIILAFLFITSMIWFSLYNKKQNEREKAEIRKAADSTIHAAHERTKKIIAEKQMVSDSLVKITAEVERLWFQLKQMQKYKNKYHKLSVQITNKRDSIQFNITEGLNAKYRQLKLD